MKSIHTCLSAASYFSVISISRLCNDTVIALLHGTVDGVYIYIGPISFFCSNYSLPSLSRLLHPSCGFVRLPFSAVSIRCAPSRVSCILFVALVSLSVSGSGLWSVPQTCGMCAHMYPTTDLVQNRKGEPQLLLPQFQRTGHACDTRTYRYIRTPINTTILTHTHAKTNTRIYTHKNTHTYTHTTHTGLSTIVTAVVGARKIFQRMTTYSKYTVAMTFRICFTFGLITVIYDW